MAPNMALASSGAGFAAAAPAAAAGGTLRRDNMDNRQGNIITIKDLIQYPTMNTIPFEFMHVIVDIRY